MSFQGLHVAILALFMAVGCATPERVAVLKITSTNTDNAAWIKAGNDQAVEVGNSANKWRSTVRSDRKNGQIRDGMVSVVGVVTGILVGAFKPNDTKTAIGITGSLVTVGIGAWSLFAESDPDVVDYIKACDDAVTKWTVANKSVLADTQKAWNDFQQKIAEIRSKYFGQADFKIIPQP